LRFISLINGALSEGYIADLPGADFSVKELLGNITALATEMEQSKTDAENAFTAREASLNKTYQDELLRIQLKRDSAQAGQKAEEKSSRYWLRRFILERDENLDCQKESKTRQDILEEILEAERRKCQNSLMAIEGNEAESKRLRQETDKILEDSGV
jgi:hypothetical protein